MNSAMAAGLQLTVLGMGLVFLLLALLWGLMALMVRLDRVEPAVAAAPEAPVAPGMDPAKRAAILTAVVRYRAARTTSAHRDDEPTGHWVKIGRTRQQQSTGVRRRT
ncbi:MAG: hypothetical protein HZB53_01610 [Chloroflexi bacterium]|nr:hypothetical protein [Chloroflexota bacterium]